MYAGCQVGPRITNSEDMLQEKAKPSPSPLATGTWVVLYFATSLALTIHNKWVLSKLNFRFPWFLTALHISFSGAGSWLVCRYSPSIPSRQLDRDAWVRLLLFSVLYALNIAMSNVSLAYVSLSFHQIVRSLVPAFILVLEAVWLSKRHPAGRKLSLIPLIFGVTLATVGEFSNVNFTTLGLVLTMAGVVLAAMKGVATNVLMVGPLKMHPLQVISHMAAPAALQCVAYGVASGETARLSQMLQKLRHETVAVTSNGGLEASPLASLLFKLTANGLLAFVLNWVSFTANQQTSALTMTVIANVKQIVSISLAIYVFQTSITTLKLLGILLTLLGATCYR